MGQCREIGTEKRCKNANRYLGKIYLMITAQCFLQNEITLCEESKVTSRVCALLTLCVFVDVLP